MMILSELLFIGMIINIVVIINDSDDAETFENRSKAAYDYNIFHRQIFMLMFYNVMFQLKRVELIMNPKYLSTEVI